MTAGYLDASPTRTTIGEIMVGNYQARRRRLQQLVYCDEQPSVWRTYDHDACNVSAGAPDGTVIEDLPHEYGNCRVHAQLNDGEDDATLDLRDLDADCTMLHVYAEEEGGVAIYYADHCR